MILKIHYKNGWIIYDGFDRVHYEIGDSKDIMKIDVDASWYEKEAMQTSILISARKKIEDDKQSAKVYSIKTDRPVYLLNDEGKTIERIN